MKTMLFIMNPFAGQKRANRVLPDILLLFSQAGYDIHTVMTTGTGAATRAAQAQAGSVDLVVCCGGDGTLNETITGLLRSGAKTPLGYIPTGTTNDFAASLGLSHNPVQAAKDILEGEVHAYDAGRFGERFFSYVASFGAFTRSSYIVPQNIRMDIDGEIVEDDFLFGAICNSTSIGGILTLDPEQVDMGDGLFEVMLVRMPRSFAELSECLRAVQSQDYNCEMITFRSASHIRVEADPTMDWSLDGEREEGHETVEVENLHHAIHLVQKKADA